MRLFKLLLAVTFSSIILSCTTEKIVTVEVEKEIERQYSWKEVTYFTNEDKIIINTSRDENRIYFQHLGSLTYYSLKNNISEINSYYGFSLPFDTRIKLPIKNYFIPAPAPWQDSLLILHGLNPIGDGYSNVINLTKIDTSFYKLVYPNIKDEIMVINNNGVLLIHYYDNNRERNNYKFILLGVKHSSNYPFIDTTFTKTIEIERNEHSYLRYFTSFDDYFIIDLGYDGVYKMNQDGSYKKVINDFGIFNYVYKYNNILYAYSERSFVYKSNDEGDNWTKYSTNNLLLRFGKHSIIADSLVGFWEDNLYTQIWNGNEYKIRFLKNDGLEYKQITGIEYLGDSVYVGTLSGLFVKPLSTFFDERK
jgi:hypothetical protein